MMVKDSLGGRDKFSFVGSSYSGREGTKPDGICSTISHHLPKYLKKFNPNNSFENRFKRDNEHMTRCPVSLLIAPFCHGR